MFADCALINRRNVTGDVSSSYRPNRDFFRVVFKSRVIGAAMSLLGFEDKSSTPSKYTLPKNMTALEKAAKLKVLHDLSAKVVDSFVFKDNVAEKVNNIISEHERRNVLNNQGLTPDGRFPCRFPGCKSSFKHNGKARRNHELAHNPPVQVENEPFQVSSTKPSPPSRPEEMKSKDDVFDYNCALLTDGYLFFNFLDAIKEGDGDRLIRQYKYFMLHCKADGTHSTKYALECLYQLFLVYALLTPRDSVCFVWNRSVNNHGKKACNIPLDESTEHSNNFIKQCIRNLGPNITEAAVSRVCKAESTTRLILENLDESLQRISRSGSHSESSEKKDLDELLKKVVSFQAFCEIEGRKYIHFKDFKRDGLENLDLSDLYQWINRHKRNVVLGIRSR
ncbi:uncharacterized protein LOC111343567 [Stylophora pistillata]|uniref:uncharacterized protein LOC111343567 n=1 Tax=Stylophora pistillata TaxID=50429 RepID=UPI000C05332F|nr:uncharacterized protein LOC111343567 [Stylophora pistillata]